MVGMSVVWCGVVWWCGGVVVVAWRGVVVVAWRGVVVVAWRGVVVMCGGDVVW